MDLVARFVLVRPAVSVPHLYLLRHCFVQYSRVPAGEREGHEWFSRFAVRDLPR